MTTSILNPWLIWLIIQEMVSMADKSCFEIRPNGISRNGGGCDGKIYEKNSRSNKLLEIPTWSPWIDFIVVGKLRYNTHQIERRVLRIMNKNKCRRRTLRYLFCGASHRYNAKEKQKMRQKWSKQIENWIVNFNYKHFWEQYSQNLCLLRQYLMMKTAIDRILHLMMYFIDILPIPLQFDTRLHNLYQTQIKHVG